MSASRFPSSSAWNACRLQVDTRWSPELHRYVPLLSESIGLEHFTLEFPWTPYPGHFLEAGYNGIHFNQVAHGWLRGLSILNSDSAIYLWGCTFVSVEDLLLDVSQSRGAYDGHRGVWLEHGSDTLVKKCAGCGGGRRLGRMGLLQRAGHSCKGWPQHAYGCRPAHTALQPHC
jgi:hypothetical protein